MHALHGFFVLAGTKRQKGPAFPSPPSPSAPCLCFCVCSVPLAFFPTQHAFHSPHALHTAHTSFPTPALPTSLLTSLSPHHAYPTLLFSLYTPTFMSPFFVPFSPTTTTYLSLHLPTTCFKHDQPVHEKIPFIWQGTSFVFICALKAGMTDIHEQGLGRTGTPGMGFAVAHPYIMV